MRNDFPSFIDEESETGRGRGFQASLLSSTLTVQDKSHLFCEVEQFSPLTLAK